LPSGDLVALLDELNATFSQRQDVLLGLGEEPLGESL
jgi:hypothetical protein